MEFDQPWCDILRNILEFLFGYGSIPILIPFLVGWTSIYQLFWCSPGVPGFWPIPISIGSRWLKAQEFHVTAGPWSPRKPRCSGAGPCIFCPISQRTCCPSCGAKIFATWCGEEIQQLMWNNRCINIISIYNVIVVCILIIYIYNNLT